MALSQITRKQGLTIYNEPILGVAIGFALSLLIYTVLLLFSDSNRHSLSLRRDLHLFWKAGVGFSLGWILTLYALSLERVSIVAPLIQTESLFIILFAYLFLKESEHISSRLVISNFLIVLGVAIVEIS